MLFMKIAIISLKFSTTVVAIVFLGNKQNWNNVFLNIITMITTISTIITFLIFIVLLKLISSLN